MKKTVFYKNTPISYVVEGTGSAIVLLHGFLEDKTMWHSIKDSLFLKNKVVCVDLLGHGESGCLGYVHTMEEMAEVVKVVLKNEKLRRVKVIGHSMGGYIALAFAEKYPENVKGLCLMNSTSQEDTRERKEMRLRAVKMAQNNYEALVSMSVVNLFSKGIRNQFKKEIEDCKTTALKTPLQGYIAGSEGMRTRKNRAHVLKSSLFKKLFIIGDNDTVLDKEMLISEAEQTKTPYVVLSGGHMSHIENEKELVKNLIDF